MIHLANRELAVELLDPAADGARLGPRFCWGGYVWQVRDAAGRPLLAGPEWPAPEPVAFNGQGLPESFRHRTRDGAPLTWRGRAGLAIGIGGLNCDEFGLVSIHEPCPWSIRAASNQVVFETRHATAGYAYALSRKIELRQRGLISTTELTNASRDTPLALQWFAHPFFTLTAGCASLQLPPGTVLPENPGFKIAPDGTLTFKRPLLAAADDQFSLLSLPPGRELTVAVDHPLLPHVTFATSFIPDECPVWANARTISVEPYLMLRLAPGETRRWHVRYSFGDNSGTASPGGSSRPPPAR